jgi:hypothetical protein
LLYLFVFPEFHPLFPVSTLLVKLQPEDFGAIF